MATSPAKTPIPGSERPRLANHNLVGPVDGSEEIGVTLILRPRPGSPPLPDLEHWQATPPGKRRFPTPEEYAQTYGAAQADLDAVAAFAKAHGLSVLESNAGRRSVTLKGTVAQLNEAFGITLNRYEGPRPPATVRTRPGAAPLPRAATMHTHHGYDGAVHLPQDLAGVVVAVVGLDNRSLGGPGTSSGDPPSSNPLSVPTVAGLYNFPNTGAADQTIGVIAPCDPPTNTSPRLSGYLSNDILDLYFPNLTDSSYRTKPVLRDVGLTVGTNTYKNNTAAVAAGDNFALEVTQDISTAATIAQGATINVYFTEFDEQGLVVCLNRILLPEGENQPTAVTCSFDFFLNDGTLGSVNNTGSPAAVMSSLFQQLALLGINAFMIAQDRGSDNGVGDGATHVCYPGSDPWVTSVGGTVIGNIQNGPPRTFEERVWSNITSATHVGGFAGATGGGASATFPVPGYQSSAGITQITDSKNNTSSKRFIPDIAGMVSYGNADNTSAHDFFYFNGSTTDFTGTSCSCPLYAGLAAVLRSAFGVTLGFLNPTLYQLGSSVFNDITTGNNDPNRNNAPFYSAGTGWDPCSGWGSIDGTNLLNGIAKLMYNQTFYFGIGKDNYGLDEVQNVLSYPQAFWLTLDGFTPAAVTGAPAPTLAGAFATLSGVTIAVGAPVMEIPTQTATPQRILFPCQVTFSATAARTTTNGGVFPTVGSAPTPLPLTASFTIQNQTFTAATVIQLLPGADPFFTNVTNINANQENAFYLSQDLRVFTATPGINSTPIAGVGTPPVLNASSNTGYDTNAGYQYVQALLNYLNANYSNAAGTDPFTLFPDQTSALTGDSSVSPSTANPANPLGTPLSNYNFAVARVRLNGTPNSTSVKNVRVFFRLFTTQTNDTDYQVNTTYPSIAEGASNPGAPTLGAGNSTIPFFATGNYEANSDFGVNNDYGANSVNNQPIAIGSGGKAWAYCGCYLNVYATQNTIGSQAVQALLNGTHHCLVAQIAFDDAPIVNSNGTTKNPENSDKLAQRNLQVTLSDNPGPPATHRIPQTFDLRPGPALRGDTGPLMDYPDELMIEWGNTPVGSKATIYWPQVSASDVLALAKQFYSTHQLFAADANTIQFTSTAGVTYVPIPPSTGENYAGLFTVDLPSGVVTRQVFNIVVRRLSSRQIEEPPPITLREAAEAAEPPGKVVENWRYVVGSFAVRIPVTTGELMLPLEENTLAIMKWRLTQIAPTSRWFPVHERYIAYIAARVDGLGGNSSAIPPSPIGVPPAAPPTEIKVEITFPPNFHTFLVGRHIEVRGNATWQPAGPSPIQSMQLSAFESRWNGFSFTRWVHVEDFALTLTPAGSEAVAWEHVVVPFDGMARYMLTAFAFDAENHPIGSSDPLFLRAVW
jgi:hypothetical protein